MSASEDTSLGGIPPHLQGQLSIEQVNSYTKTNCHSTPETSSSASVTSTLSTTIASGTQSSSTPTATSTTAANCPSGNNTVYSVPGSDKKFLQLCGVDYSGKEEAVDLANVLTANMKECMDNCAGFTGCTACGWGVIDGDKGDDHRCWLKNDLGKSHKATSNWTFAILQ